MHKIARTKSITILALVMLGNCLTSSQTVADALHLACSVESANRNYPFIRETINPVTGESTNQPEDDSARISNIDRLPLIIRGLCWLQLEEIENQSDSGSILSRIKSLLMSLKSDKIRTTLTPDPSKYNEMLHAEFDIAAVSLSVDDGIYIVEFQKSRKTSLVFATIIQVDCMIRTSTSSYYIAHDRNMSDIESKQYNKYFSGPQIDEIYKILAKEKSSKDAKRH